MTARRRKKPSGPAVLADPAGCGGASRQRQSNLSTPTVPKSGGESSRWSRWVLSHATESSWLGACEPRPASGGLRGGGLSWWPGAGACGWWPAEWRPELAAWGLAACLVVGRRVDSCLVVACRGAWPRAGATPTRAGGRRCPLRTGAMAVRGWPPPTRPARLQGPTGLPPRCQAHRACGEDPCAGQPSPPIAGPVSPPVPPAPPATGSPPPRC